MNDGGNLVCAYVLDGTGSGREIGWSEIHGQTTGFVWIHLQRTGEEGRRWLWSQSGLDPFVCDALLGHKSLSTEAWIKQGHPRSIPYGDGVIVNLRGINFNPGANPNDMVSVRIWLDRDRVITVRQRHVRAIDDIRETLRAGNGPQGPGDFLVALTGRLIDRIAVALVDLNDATDECEQTVITDPSAGQRQRLRTLRRRAIAKRRHLVPQREALLHLGEEPISWIDEEHRARLHVITDRAVRQVEDLDAIRERAAIIQDEIFNHLSAQTNRTVYILSLVAAIFLPISFLTGLFGVNLAGMPGKDSPWSFPIACVVLLLLTFLEVWMFRRWKWF